jgi:HlyD family secretion protein
MRIVNALPMLMLLWGCNNESARLALGTLERDRIAHSATTNEVVVALPVLQGSLVEKGAILVKLDDTYQKALVSKASADVSQATVNLEKLRKGAREEENAAARANVAGAKARLVQSEASYKRLQNIAREDLASQANLDRALAARDSNQASLTNAEEKLRELVKGTRDEDLRIAEAHLEATEATLNGEKKKLADLTIRATRSGVLDNLPWNLGERVTSGSPLAVVLADQSPYVRVYIPEPYRVKINVNDKLTVHVDGLETTYIGYVRWISTEPAFTPYYALNQQERSRLMYLAEVQLPDSASGLPNGIPAQVELP